MEDDEPKTVVSALPQELLQELQGGGKPAPASGDDDGWFLGDDRGEYGPMTFAELAARCQRGEPGPNAEAWREGFADWRPLEEIPELKPYVKVAPPPRPLQGSHLPASPYTKTPAKDVAGQTPAPASKAPLPAKVTSAPRPEDSLVKIPRAAPDATPPPAESRWPEPAPMVPTAATPPPMTAAAALTPEPFLPAGAGAGAGAAQTAASSTGAHVSPGVGQPLPNPSLVEIKRERRPTLLIGAAVLLLSVGVIVLVVFLITSRKKPTSPSSTTTAEVSMATAPPMRLAVAAPPMRPMSPMKAPPEDDSTELDLDIDVSTGMVTRSMRRRPVRGTMRPRPVMEVMHASSSGGSLYGLPAMRPGFVGLMGFGSPSMTSVTASGGGRPGDLRSVIKRNYNRLRRCYEKAARLNSRIKNPRLRITVKVSAAGKCRSVYVSPARYQSNTLGICVRRTIMSWRWPSFSTGYRWTFSARFSAG